MLREVAQRLRKRLRGYDVLGRWEGEAFIALVPGIPDDATLRTLAEQIAGWSATCRCDRRRDAVPVTVSMGAVRAGDALRSVERLAPAQTARSPRRSAGWRSHPAVRRPRVEDLVAEEPRRFGWPARSHSPRARAPACRT